MRKYAYFIFALLLAVSCGKDAPEPSVREKVYSYANVPSDNGNVPGSGVISTQFSDSPYGQDIGKLMDDDVSTTFVTEHESFYVLWSGKKAFALKSYAIVSPAADAAGAVPDSWVLSGSNDNRAWIQLDKKRGETFAGASVKKEYRITGSSTYKYYRFVFTASAQPSAIAEIYLADGAATDINDLMYLSGGDTHSSLTPMGKFCENRHKTTAADREWLLNPANEPTVGVENGEYTWQNCEVTLYPYGSPVPADVNQHGVGDCSALAVFGSMAYLYPEFIKSIITDNGDHTYTVKMYDPAGEPIDVALSSQFLCGSDNNCGGVTSKHDVVCWSTILEKAVMKWNSVYHCNSILDGIATEHTSPLFVGNGDSFAFDSGVLDYSQMDRAVNVLLNQGYLVIGGFREDGKVIGDGPYKTVSYHAFTFVLDAGSGASYGMRNPWGFANGGDGDDPRDGVAPIVDDGRTQPLIDLRVCHPGAAYTYKQPYLGPYEPVSW